MLARKFSDCSFTIVGLSDDVAAKLGPLPANLVIHRFMPQEQFMSLMAESRYVLQLSVSEGFPNALCEAMLCHCIPVGSAVGPVPSIIGDTGYIIENPDPEYLTARMQEILGANVTTQNQMGLRARERIAALFHISRREKAFLDLLETEATGR
jgi:glycosyltransferase involved in cell wall biosynthesis